MSVLEPWPFLREDMYWHRPMAEVGGVWTVDTHRHDQDRILAECRERGVRALSVHGKDISFVRHLPDLEFLDVGDCGDVTPAMAVEGLRGFSAATWEGRVDAHAWPRLERFGGGEPKHCQGAETAWDHPSVRRLGLPTYREADLRAITAPRLTDLHLSGGRLLSLDGIEQHAATLEVLTLSRASGLASLRGVESLERLQLLEVQGAKQVRTLDDAAKAPALRLLDVFDQSGIESLGPLAGHPTLEFVTFGRTGDMSLDALLHVPSLRLVLGPPNGWTPDIHELPYLHDRPEDDPDRVAYYDLRLRA